jgi:hypothetical protein
MRVLYAVASLPLPQVSLSHDHTRIILGQINQSCCSPPCEHMVLRISDVFYMRGGFKMHSIFVAHLGFELSFGTKLILTMNGTVQSLQKEQPLNLTERRKPSTSINSKIALAVDKL